MITNLLELGSDERQLILNCSRLELDNQLLKQTEEILRKPLGWDTVLFYAKFHSVAPLLYRNLKLFNGLNSIPQEIKRTLLKLIHRTEYQNRILSRTLHDILRDFADAEIPLMVLKGISLVELIYGHLNLRPLIDLNLLIPEQGLESAKKLLLERGFSLRKSPFQGKGYSQIHLAKQGDHEVHVLLQWHIINWPRMHSVNMNRVWADAQSVRLAGRDALIPSPADFILYMCLQPDKHCFLNAPAIHAAKPAQFIFTEWTNNRLIRFVDIYEVIRHYRNSLDWNLLGERAKENGIQETVYTSLDWVTKMIGQVTEPSFLNRLTPPSPRRLRKWFFEALANQSNGYSSSSKNKTLFRIWWLKKKRFLRIRIIHLLNFFEYMFPRLNEISFFYRLNSNKMAVAVYPYHFFKTFSFEFLPWTYRTFLEKRSRFVFKRFKKKLKKKDI
jgi:hypothetical protein